MLLLLIPRPWLLVGILGTRAAATYLLGASRNVIGPLEMRRPKAILLGYERSCPAAIADYLETS